jgi:hypothetical protein
MPLPKQTVNIPFTGGIDTKTDPKQVKPVKLLNLENAQFDVIGQLSKRNGFDEATVSVEFQNNDVIEEAGSLFTKDDEIIMNARQTLAASGRTAPDDGWRFYSWMPNQVEWRDVGVLEPLEIDVIPGMASTELDIIYFDVAVCLNFYCFVYMTELLAGGTFRIYYSIYDVDTGTTIYDSINVTSSYPDGLHVVAVGSSFHIYAIDAANNELGRVIIDTTSLETAPVSPVSMAVVTSDVHADGLFDVTTIVDGGTPYAVVGYKVTVTGQVRWRWYNEAGGAGAVATTAEVPVNVVSMQELYDVTTTNFRIAASYQIAGGNIRSELRNPDGTLYTAIRTVTAATAGETARNITCVEDPSLDAAAPGATSTIRWYIEIEDDIGAPYGGATPWYYYIRQVEYDFGNTSQADLDTILNAGLASKAFLYEGKARVWITYDTTFQKSLFLTQARDGTTARYDARTLYMRGGGITYGPGLPQVINPSGTTFLTTAIRQERLVSIKPDLEDESGPGEGELLLSTIGLSVTFGGNALDRCELGPTKTVCGGGYVGDFDGRFQELNFHIFPEEIGTDEIGGGLGQTTYNYRAHYEWMDRKGQIHRSAVSPIYSFTTVGAPGTTGVRHWVPCIHKGEIDKLEGPTASPGKTHTTRISVFREWTDGLYHKIGQVTGTDNDITVAYIQINDQVLDVSANEILYTEGGILEDYGPPETRICAVRQNRAFIVPEEDRELIWYSKAKVEGLGVQFSPFLTRRITAGGEIIALAELDEKIIVFKRNEIHAFSGRGPDPTGQGPQFTETFRITTDVGCRDRRTVVQMDKGIIFQSLKGIYLLTRGLDVQYIGAEVESYTDVALVVKAFEFERKNQLRLLMSSGDILVFDTLVSQWSVYTNATWDAGFLVDSVVWDGDYHFLDNTGMVHEETVNFEDEGVYIPMVVETSWFKLADLQGFQRIDWISLLGVWRSPHTLTVDVYTDYNPVARYTKTINAPTSLSPYQYRFKPSRGYAKCEAFKLRITDADAGVGNEEGLSLSAIAIDYKIKKGLYKQSKSRTV